MSFQNFKVVAGVNYKLVVDVYFPDHSESSPSCTVENFVVYDHFGKLSLTSHSVSPLECMDTPVHRRRNLKWTGHVQKGHD